MGDVRQSGDAVRPLGFGEPLFDFVVVRGPRDDDPIGGHAPVQHAVGDAVHVFNVLGQPHAKPVEIEMCVARDQRIERPVDDRGAQVAHHVPLVLLEPPAKAEVSRVWPHGQHVRPVNRAAALDPGESEHEAEQSAVADRTRRWRPRRSAGRP